MRVRVRPAITAQAGRAVPSPPAGRRLRAPALALAVLSVAALVSVADASSAAAAKPWWHLTSRMIPSRIAPGGEGTIVVQAINVGNQPTASEPGPDGELGTKDDITTPYTLTDVLPPGFTLQESHYFPPNPKAFSSSSRIDLGPAGFLGFFEYCKNTSSTISCSIQSPLFPPEPFEVAGKVSSFYNFLVPPVVPYDELEMQLKVKAEPGATSSEENEVKITGGGASPVSAKKPIPVGEEPIPFGIEDFSLLPEEEGGEPDGRAGSHPYQLAGTVTFNRGSTNSFLVPALARSLHFRLPPGQIANAKTLPQCSDADFSHPVAGGLNVCPATAAIGATIVTFATEPGSETIVTVPVFNLTPATGEPARFGFVVLGYPVILDTAVRSGPGEDYGVTVNVSNITQLVSFLSVTTVFWGTPGDPSHNESRGWGCIVGGRFAAPSGQACVPSGETHPEAFLTLPTSCEQPYNPVLSGEAWPKKTTPGGPLETQTFEPVPYPLHGNPLSLTGCNQLAFEPTMKAEPTAASTSSPSGLDVNLNFDDEGLTAGSGRAQSQLKDTTVTLPEGLTINPSSGVGLGGCTQADYAKETVESPPGAGCPNNSKLGTVEIETPLLKQVIHGSLFVAQPFENPFNSLIALYIVAKNPETGILVKLAGKVTPNPATGQLVTTFKSNPQLPFNHFNFHFREGQQAPLITPPTCGTYAIQALLTPWSEPIKELTDTSPFNFSSGVGGGACPSGGAPPFSPQIAAGTLNNNAGAFSEFDLHLTRGDADQEITQFSTNLPPGLEGILTGIPFCPEPDIALARTKSGVDEQNSPSCPAASQLGHSNVGTGVGTVLAYTPGRVYLAGPYDGDPFSLVSVTSAVVGPFDLGTVVVRFGLHVDPTTAQISVDPTASEPIPHIIQGIVTHVRDIRVYIDRPGFTFNPTSCAPMAISSTLTGSQGSKVTIASPFQAASCANLKFTPTVTVTTAAKSSKANGSSLVFKIAYPKGAMGSQSWFNEAKFDLPKQLPARLTTIQKACLASAFESNPARCPAASLIGHAVVHTPVLPVPLTGPVYFVSHGGAKFPDAILLLKGYGVTVDLVGETFINGKTGITSATFRNTPDVPFESIEVTVPSGPFSEFGANLPAKAKGSFCGQKLIMPTLFKAQNGLEIHQNTKVGVTGCGKAKTRKQLLTAALKACHKKHNKARRAACQRAARKRYGPIKKRK